MSEKSRFNFWNIFGKIAVFIGFIWTIMQIINWYNEDDGFNIVATGNHSSFRIPNNYKDKIAEYQKSLRLDKAYRDVVNSRGLSHNKLMNYYETTDNEEFKKRYDFHKTVTNFINLPEYNSSWVFEIKNNGKKPLEELILETPFKGEYRLQPKNGKAIFGSFEKNINLPDLNPGFSLSVRIWINESFLFNDIDEEKTRITHKFGFQPITYPVKVQGFTRWLTGNNYLHLELFIAFLIFLIVGTFFLGVSSYPKFAENEKKRKIEEYKRNEEIKKLLEKEDKENNGEISPEDTK